MKRELLLLIAAVSVVVVAVGAVKTATVGGPWWSLPLLIANAWVALLVLTEMKK